MESDIIIIIAGVLQLIMIICFFYLCFNVSRLKKRVAPCNNFKNLMSGLIAMNKKDQARDILVNEILSQLYSLNESISFDSTSLSEKDVDLHIKKYKKYMTLLDVEFDSGKFLEIRNLK